MPDSWQGKGNCYGLYYKLGEDLWFPPDNPGGPKQGRGITGERVRIAKAKALCQDCPVVKECLQYALDNECQGIWGNTTDQERRHMTRREAAA